MIDQILKENLIVSYDAEAQRRSQEEDPEWKVAERENFLGWMIEENSSSVLDLGAGPGKDSLFFKENGIQPLAIDISPEMVRICRGKGLEAEVLSLDEMNRLEKKFGAVWAMNSLLHIPRKEIENVLRDVHEVLEERGLFYMGLYGGIDSEGIWEGDIFEPKRFFSLHTSVDIQKLVSPFFSIENMVVLPPHAVDSKLEFQSLILRKKKV
ncbi:class I SAM-dependent methyltransferase [Bacillus sp. P14.5]|uniref:class I SAM-dependent DNA methyltransferase n=1 Tax=Bacillus sp. P14.5 TaxID=1983400 RepID=UPI001F053F8F|nr:class I SAM-dependent methyltransferase [Bacillus sp. P14.5]